MKRKPAASTAVRAVRKNLGSVLRRIIDDAEDARYRDVQREVQRLIGHSGGHWSDEIERRITQHLMRNSSF
jgi:hypothetical protein